jgi:hypothetical protein
MYTLHNTNSYSNGIGERRIGELRKLLPRAQSARKQITIPRTLTQPLSNNTATNNFALLRYLFSVSLTQSLYIVVSLPQRSDIPFNFSRCKTVQTLYGYSQAYAISLAGQLRIRNLGPGSGKIFLSMLPIPVLGLNPASCLIGTGGYFPWSKVAAE